MLCVSIAVTALAGLLVVSKAETCSKRGFGAAVAYATAGDAAALSGSTAWWYDWSLNMPDADNDTQQEFVPMVWGKSKLSGLTDFTPVSGTTAILGFNEPNLHTQSNLTASAACELWPTLLAFASKNNLRVGSPAANYCTPGGTSGQDTSCYQNATDWLDEFFALDGCGVDTVDFVTTHKYGCNSDSLVEWIETLSTRYNKTVWLTEFSCSDAGAASQLAFQEETLPQLDNMSSLVLERYAWFATRTYQNSAQINAGLLNEDGSQNLTTLGKYYNTSC